MTYLTEWEGALDGTGQDRELLEQTTHFDRFVRFANSDRCKS